MTELHELLKGMFEPMVNLGTPEIYAMFKNLEEIDRRLKLLDKLVEDIKSK